MTALEEWWYEERRAPPPPETGYPARALDPWGRPYLLDPDNPRSGIPVSFVAAALDYRTKLPLYNLDALHRSVLDALAGHPDPRTADEKRREAWEKYRARLEEERSRGQAKEDARRANQGPGRHQEAEQEAEAEAPQGGGGPGPAAGGVQPDQEPREHHGHPGAGSPGAGG